MLAIAITSLASCKNLYKVKPSSLQFCNIYQSKINYERSKHWIKAFEEKNPTIAKNSYEFYMLKATLNYEIYPKAYFYNLILEKCKK